jgi:toxin-antitoxin system PIN domain toxin
VKVVDANVLLYAVNSDAPQHDDSRTWLDAALSGGDRVGLSWVVLLAFLRLSTRSGLFSSPLTPTEAFDQVGDWTQAPGGEVIHPSPTHVTTLQGLLAPIGLAGNLVNDAHLAAVAVEHRAEIVSYDNDFSRFPGVRWSTPGALLA